MNGQVLNLPWWNIAGAVWDFIILTGLAILGIAVIYLVFKMLYHLASYVKELYNDRKL